MARFLAAIKGQRGEATRLGSPSSGITARVNGWNVGVNVYGAVDPRDRDTFAIFMTGGSNGGTGHRPLGLVRLDENGIPTFFPTDDVYGPIK